MADQKFSIYLRANNTSCKTELRDLDMTRVEGGRGEELCSLIYEKK